IIRYVSPICNCAWTIVFSFLQKEGIQGFQVGLHTSELLTLLPLMHVHNISQLLSHSFLNKDAHLESSQSPLFKVPALDTAYMYFILVSLFTYHFVLCRIITR